MFFLLFPCEPLTLLSAYQRPRARQPIYVGSWQTPGWLADRLADRVNKNVTKSNFRKTKLTNNITWGACLIKIHAWSSLMKLDQVWSSLIEPDQAWSSLQSWSSLIRPESSLIKLDQAPVRVTLEIIYWLLSRIESDRGSLSSQGAASCQGLGSYQDMGYMYVKPWTKQ